MMGNSQTRLIVIRGNSGSGKSALAAAIRSSLPRGVAIIGQDVLRRNILHVPDTKPSMAADYMEISAHFALDRRLSVIVEGILQNDIYGDMLRRLISDHQGITRCYRYKIPFQETLKRHNTKPNAGDFGESEMRQWWREDDGLRGVDETLIGPDQSLADTTIQIIADCGWEPLPLNTASKR
ncbi:zeta toxin family protein [Pleomorphomonas diazotrophica]|uniref:zeta toxin family protein n=1 Tax=Pleomorphomonas diazotrophica TaxID=1166257 RepID=UPI0015D5CE47|nr:zeta toxin family protein [Pleomorphomonas diazotrophica]